MTPLVPKKPANPLPVVKRQVKANKISFVYYDDKDKDPLQTAFFNFGWFEEDIRRALLKLNDLYHKDNREKNHFDKHEIHRKYPPSDQTYMDYYKAKKLMGNKDVYTHLHLRENNTLVIVDSFHHLD